MLTPLQIAMASDTHIAEWLALKLRLARRIHFDYPIRYSLLAERLDSGNNSSKNTASNLPQILTAADRCPTCKLLWWQCCYPPLLTTFTKSCSILKCRAAWELLTPKFYSNWDVMQSFPSRSHQNLRILPTNQNFIYDVKRRVNWLTAYYFSIQKFFAYIFLSNGVLT
jgi:hypothetical protein